jgi:predicted MFS family arabinose efflux permease
VIIPIFLFLDTEQRAPLMVGLVYAGIYVLTSIASKKSSKLVKKGSDAVTSINVVFLLSAAGIILSGLLLLLDSPVAVVGCFIVLFIFQNIRRPMEVDYLSNLISRKTMASGLSVESQLKSLVTAIAAPLIGIAIDNYGLSTALIVLGGVTLIAGWLLRLSPVDNSQVDIN